MPNGKPGDHPVTDVVVHGYDLFSPRVNALLREIAAIGETRDLFPLSEELFEAEHVLGRLENRLVEIRERLRATRAPDSN